MQLTNLRTMVVLALGLPLGAALAGCTDVNAGATRSDGGNVDPAANDGGDSGGKRVCNMDFTRLKGADPVSFKDDVIPIFVHSCTQSSCHDAEQPKGAMFLGPSTSYNLETMALELAPGEPTPEQLSKVYSGAGGCDPDARDASKCQGIVDVPSLTAPAARRVAPNEPGESFLIYKIAGVPNAQGVECDSIEASECGAPMPTTGVALCLQSGGQERFDTIATWILQGAPNN